jgi:hypothetical protein
MTRAPVSGRRVDLLVVAGSSNAETFAALPHRNGPADAVARSEKFIAEPGL